jgi:hypothetical protein
LVTTAVLGTVIPGGREVVVAVVAVRRMPGTFICSIEALADCANPLDPNAKNRVATLKNRFFNL